MKEEEGVEMMMVILSRVGACRRLTK